MEEADRADEAIDWLQTRATEAGDPDALWVAARLLEQTDRADEAAGLYQHAAEAGDLFALAQAVRLLERTGRRDEAARLRQYGLEPGGKIADEWN
jgi:hypothetical protein